MLVLKGHLRRRAAQDTYIPERYMMMMRKAPSLVDLCVQMAVDNVRYLGDLGETDLHLLDRILPHCTVDQLRHIEDSTEVRETIFYITFTKGKSWLGICRHSL